MQKWVSIVFEVFAVTNNDVLDSSKTGWNIDNFAVSPKVGEVWCVVTRFGKFHMAFKVE